MPSIELSKLQGIAPARALSESDRARAETRASSGASASGGPNIAQPGVSIEVSGAANPASPPVDTDRVDQIREALKDGSYPLVPAKIADAMIAARVSLEVEKQ